MSGSGVERWQQFAAELAEMPALVERLLGDHVPGRRSFCNTCTTGGQLITR